MSKTFSPDETGRNKIVNKRVALIALCLLITVFLGIFYIHSKNINYKALDYSITDNWAVKEISEDKSADVFLICPTVDMGRDGNLNLSIDNEKMRNNFVGAVNMEKGIYNVDANIYAPFYRQITFPVYSMDSKEAKEAVDIAYNDVNAAFKEFIAETDKNRPIILAGFSQGSQMLIRLMEDCSDNKMLQERLVAAYAIGWRVTDDDLNTYKHLKMAKTSNDIGVIVMYNSEAEGIDDSMIVPKGTHTYSINPLNWKTDDSFADATYNKGACFTNYSGEIEIEIPKFSGAYLNKERGTLIVTDISPDEYPGKMFEDGIYHIYDYQFFYRNLQDNVLERIEEWKKVNLDK